jgi:branched-chain amino acid transport system ATP-binding protein
MCKQCIVQALEGRRVFEHLTGEENLQVGAFNRTDRGAVKEDLEMVYDYFPRLKDVRGNIAGYLSGGEQQMLVIGRAMMATPKLMLLDEPSLGLAPLMVQEIFDIIRRFNAEKGTSVLLVEQNVRIALSIAHHGYIMENGRIVLDGSAEFLKNNEDVKEFYMGLSAVGAKKSYRAVKHYKRRKRWL